MTKLKQLIALFGLVFFTSISHQAMAQGFSAYFYISSAGCQPLTSGLSYNHGWQSTQNGARIVCPVFIGDGERYQFQADVVPIGSRTALACRHIDWHSQGHDIKGAIECTLNQGDSLYGHYVRTERHLLSGNGDLAQSSRFLGQPTSSCYVTSGTATFNHSLGTISASGSNTVSVRCPLVSTNQSRQNTARFTFNRGGTASCSINASDLYGRVNHSESTWMTKFPGAWDINMNLPPKENYLFASCTFAGTTFSGIDY